MFRASFYQLVSRELEGNRCEGGIVPQVENSTRLDRRLLLEIEPILTNFRRIEKVIFSFYRIKGPPQGIPQKFHHNFLDKLF